MRCLKNRYLGLTFLLILLLSGRILAEKEVSNESDLKKRADKYFSDDNFESALPDYSRLLSLYPGQTFYNYRYGVCVLMAGKEKSNAATYLENASKDARAEEEVWYYLGKSYINNNDFSRAKDAFMQFKKIANTTKQKKYEIDACIQNCENGLVLIKQRKTIVIQKSDEVSRSNFYSNYFFDNSPGRVVAASDQFLTQTDKLKLNEPVMYIGNDKKRVFFASYGNTEDHGKDIFLIKKTPDNLWSDPENIGSVINSSADEDFAFLDRDGRTLYFSSKGHNSIGGYDIFKSVYNYNTREWSKPENLGIPINTPGDDLLFVMDEGGKTATYSTNIETTSKNISVRKIEVPKGMSDLLTISGVYIPQDQKMRRDARISILNSSGDGIITSVHTDPVTGKYEVALTPGQNYMIVVEGGGYLPHAEMFDFPEGLPDSGLKQVVKINKDDQKEELTLVNYFSKNGSSEPSRVISRSYATNIDESAMMGVKIGDQIVYVTPPEKQDQVDEQSTGNSETDKSSNGVSSIDNGNTEVKDSTGLPSITLKRKDEYDPTLQRGLTPDEIKQKEEEEARKKDIEEDELTPTKAINENVSNEELAKIAYDEARDIQIEADSLTNEVVTLREQAAEKENYSVIFKNRADAVGVDPDSIAILKAQSQSSHSEAEDLLKQADVLAIDADAKDAEAKTAMDEANEIFNNGSSATATTSSKTKKSSEENKSETKQAAETIPSTTNNITPVENTIAKDNLSNSTVLEKDSTTNSENNQKTGSVGNDVQPTHSLDEEMTLTEHKNTSSEKLNATNDIKNDNSPKTELKYDENEVVNVIIKGKAIPGLNDENGSKSANELKGTEEKSETVTNTENVSEVSPSNDSSNVVVETNKDHAIITESKIDSSIATNDNPTPAATEKKDEQSGNNEISKGTEKNDSIAVSENVESTTAIQSNVESEKPAETTSDINQSPENVNPEISTSSEQVKPVEEKIDNQNVEPAVTEQVTNANDSNAIKPSELLEEKPTGETLANSNTVITKNDSGESPKIDNPSIIQLSDDPKNQAMPVKPEAVQLYREYQTLLKHSNDLTKQSLGMQEEVSRLASTPKRDSLIRASNELTMTSIREWQEGLKKIQDARKIDPGVEYKMNVNDYAANRARNNEAEGITAKEKQTGSDSTLEANAITNKPSDVKPSDPSANTSVNLSDESEANIDKSHPDYPKYVSLKSDIQKGQVETIDVFAEAIKLSKLASEERDLEVSLMDQARMESDSVKKADLIRQSFEHKAQAEKYESESKEKFAEAQKHTNDVKGLKAQLAILREKISKSGQDNMTASATSNPVDQIISGTKKTNTNKSKIKNDSGPIVNLTGRENELSLNESEINKVNVGKSEMDNFIRTVFNKDPSFSYSEKNPIPMDPQLPEGLVFKVQIGAFRSPLPSDKFKGIQPLTGETTRPGWIRYCAGLFRGFEPANVVKKDIQKMGYRDAFVVAYYNGKRIELNDAYNKIRESQNLTAYKDESAKEIAILKKLNVHDDKSISAEDDYDVREFYGKPALSDDNVASGVKEYTVQVGVFNTSDVPGQISTMSPLQYLMTKSEKYKFTFGRFKNYNQAVSAKKYAVNAGIKDAFIVTYRKGTSVNQAEPESDISSLSNSISESVKSNPVHANNASTVDPNSEIEEVVTSNGQVYYKVQIGAYRTNIPYNLVESYVSIMDKGITHKTDDRGLHIFYAGNCKSFKEATVLLQEVLSKGVKDAFVVALKDGKRIPLTDEMKK